MKLNNLIKKGSVKRFCKICQNIITEPHQHDINTLKLNCGCIVRQNLSSVVNNMPTLVYKHACPEHFKLHSKLKDKLNEDGSIPAYIQSFCEGCGKYKTVEVYIKQNKFLCIYCDNLA